MVCKHCGQNLPDGGRFCEGCGAPVSSAPAALRGHAAPPGKRSFSALPILLVAVLAVGIGAGALLIPRLSRGGGLAQELRDASPAASVGGGQSSSAGGSRASSDPPGEGEASDSGQRPQDPEDAQPRETEAELSERTPQSAVQDGFAALATQPWKEPGYDPTADIVAFDWASGMTSVPPEDSSPLTTAAQVAGRWLALRVDEEIDGDTVRYLDIDIAAYDEALHGGSGLSGEVILTMTTHYTLNEDNQSVTATPVESQYSVTDGVFVEEGLFVSEGSEFEWYCLLWELDGGQYGIMTTENGENAIALMRA